MNFTIDPNWLRTMAAREDGCIISVGGLFHRSPEPAGSCEFCPAAGGGCGVCRPQPVDIAENGSDNNLSDNDLAQKVWDSFQANKAKSLVNKPRHLRTPDDVRELQGSVYGCCNQHADQCPCDCLRESQAALAASVRGGVKVEEVSREHTFLAENLPTLREILLFAERAYPKMPSFHICALRDFISGAVSVLNAPGDRR